jgi:hypothetical protein
MSPANACLTLLITREMIILSPQLNNCLALYSASTKNGANDITKKR